MLCFTDSSAHYKNTLRETGPRANCKTRQMDTVDEKDKSKDTGQQITE